MFLKFASVYRMVKMFYRIALRVDLRVDDLSEMSRLDEWVPESARVQAPLSMMLREAVKVHIG